MAAQAEHIRAAGIGARSPLRVRAIDACMLLAYECYTHEGMYAMHGMTMYVCVFVYGMVCYDM
jgi:hypothetical protein